MPFDFIPGGRLPLTGGTLNLPLNGGLTITAYDGATTTLNYANDGMSPTPRHQELVFVTDRPFYGVTSFQNLAPLGYAAITARDENSRERCAWGFGNSLSSGNYQSASYWEGWNGYPVDVSQNPPSPLHMVQSGYNTLFNPATSTASTISGTVLTVGGSITGTFKANQVISGAGVTAGTYITSFWTGTGGAGTYNISAPHSIAVPQPINGQGEYASEVRLKFTDDGYLKLGRWQDHGVFGTQMTPDGRWDMIASVSGEAVLSLRNQNTAGYGAIRYLNDAGSEKLAAGVGNSASSRWAGLAYIAVAGNSDTLTVAQNATVRAKLMASGGLNIGSHTTDTSAGEIRLLNTGAFRIDGRVKFSAASDGNAVLQNDAGSGMTSLAFGGTTSSFPALLVNGANLQVKLADNSGYTALHCGGLQLNGGALSGCGDFTQSTGNLNLAAASIQNWSGRTRMNSASDGTVQVANNANTAGVTLDVATADTLKVKNKANNADGAVTASVLTLSKYAVSTTINTQTGASYTVVDTDTDIIANRAGTVTLTLPTASAYTGREIVVKTVTANTVVSNASNVVPANSTSAGTAILAATAGKFARLKSDGANWIIMDNN